MKDFKMISTQVLLNLAIMLAYEALVVIYYHYFPGEPERIFKNINEGFGVMLCLAIHCFVLTIWAMYDGNTGEPIRMIAKFLSIGVLLFVALSECMYLMQVVPSPAVK